MISKFFVRCAAVFFLSFQLAAAPEFTEDYPERYTVVKGDTLWDISERFLKSPWLWPEVWHANPQVANPHLIYPGDVIGLIYIDGQPRITTLKEGPNNGVKKLSPQVRSTPIETAIPTIPLDAIASFLSTNRIVTAEELEAAPYILSGKEDHLITGAGDQVFARGDVKGENSVGVFRKSEQYVDPDSKEFLGLEAKSIATAEVDAVQGEVITLTVQRSSEELRIGDRVLPTDDRVINSTFTPSKPDGDIRGKMIAVESGVGNIGQYNVVVVNRGAREGIKEGNVLAVYKSGGIVRDPYTQERIELPSERAGLMMIFRVFDKLSYGLILRANRPLKIMDEVRTP
ncbi:peptidoglycan-binding protein [Oleiphilus sp. HI0009]|uniref:LysM peptidoglycan-binding domain-containing protein n=1 Tax=unclassified Oleiphilus TaxID=2631174 RepID=UPI0007C28494|nr:MULTISPECIES: LysM peptidoglycan-binding domain-containing protein [unclassified Oleiphilus]KZX72592.1 peptidoglycan-binding protein [Oleiphilus sp. HI0009]KZY70677.1 peptidoglycan-binding protein [Oleiphilus sp. HI0066]KZY71352.1 peptidoglycan-binding protein [Oleiphilus sp. HI0067]KZZ57086.1 peptidoglycan-binding protein [Oleiphilus sp. HI0125]